MTTAIHMTTPRSRSARSAMWITRTTWSSRPGPVDHLDHASYQQFWGGKAGIDATRKTPAEGYHRGWPEATVMSPDVVAKVSSRWQEYGL